MADEQKHISGGNPYHYDVPDRTDAKVILLTVGGTAVIGNWYGKYGEHFVGWAPLPTRDREAECCKNVLQPAVPWYPPERTDYGNWVEWSGGPAPDLRYALLHNKLVDILYRSERYSQRHDFCPFSLEFTETLWVHRGSMNDVVAYRVEL